MNMTHRHPLPLLDLDVLRTFVAIAETGNFSTAAEIVFRTPSAVSMQIKKLEEMLGTVLFLRDARSVSMTIGGERLLPYARRMLAMSNETVSRFVMPNMSGVVRLGAPDDIGERILPKVLKSFAETCPAVAVDVVIASSPDVLRMVEEQRLDLAVYNTEIGDDRNIGEVLSRESLVWAAASGGTAHLREPLPVSVWSGNCSWRGDAVKKLETTGRPFRVAYMTASNTAQKAAVNSDLAIAPLQRYMVTDDMVVLGEREGLPELGTYEIRMVLGPRQTAIVNAVAESIRWTFGGLEMAA
jgi:DNA-binding transcriptional LysR family regulator